METNVIIQELRARASLGWNPEQQAWFDQQANDARPVECSAMRDVFDNDQMLFLRVNYRARRHQCYKNASDLVCLIWEHSWLFPDVAVYVEGLTYPCGLLPIEHAFVKIGDKYIDPTFERVLHRDVRKEMYVSLIELWPPKMVKYQNETGFYGGLYEYDYMCKNRPELAAKIRVRNPHNRA